MAFKPGATVWPAEIEAAFCDAIADGMSIADAGRLVGKSRGAAAGRWRRICALYPEQAK